MRYGVLHVAHFSLQAVVRTDSTLDGRPVALVSSEVKKPLVLQANAAARATGVQPGLTSAQALARCGNLQFRTASAEAEAEARVALLTCGLDRSPTIEETASGVCTIDFQGVALETREAQLHAAVKQLDELGLFATAGLASTPLLALYAARQAQPVLAINHDPSFLAPLPLSVAEPTFELSEILSSWGITTLGQLTALSKTEVAKRLGPDGYALWLRASGGDFRPLNAFVPPAEFHAVMEFEHDLETLEALLFILKRFVDRLALQLRVAGLIAAELTLELTLADDKHYERSFRLPEPTGDESILFRTLHTHLESLQTEAAISGLRLHILPTRPLAKQPGLFDSGLRDPHGFSETLARVVAIVGSGRVGTPQLIDTHRPDAFALVAPTTSVEPGASVAVLPTLGLVLRRFRPPYTLQISLEDNVPVFLSAPGLHSPIVAVRGPYHASGDWWKPESWAREEWDIELAIGGLYRLVQSEGHWYLEGEYD